MQIWEFASPESTRYLANWAEDMAYHVSEPCPLEPEKHPHINSRRYEQLSILLTEYRGVSPITWTWHAPDGPVVREDVLQVLREHEVTGFEAKPVKARYKLRSDEEECGRANRGITEQEVARAPAIPALWELQLRGWGGVAPEESGARLEKHCLGCGYRHYSDITHPEKLFDNSQWDGSDFFMIWPLPAHFFVTDRVAEIIRKHKWQRCRLVPIEQLTFTGSGLSPGGLRSKMPEERARTIGEPLGIY